MNEYGPVERRPSYQRIKARRENFLHVAGLVQPGRFFMGLGFLPVARGTLRIEIKDIQVTVPAIENDFDDPSQSMLATLGGVSDALLISDRLQVD